MSHLASGVLGTVAAALALGAVHLEVQAGNDLLGPVQRGDASLRDTIDLSVNRDAKADRNEVGRVADGVTISFRIPGVTNSSVMMRVPVANAQSDKRAPQPTAGDTTKFRPKLACESQVSLLTAVAKQLQPGRCVT
jgi:hypothetical protein